MSCCRQWDGCNRLTKRCPTVPCQSELYGTGDTGAEAVAVARIACLWSASSR
jgi:hypothetical protein